MGLAVAQRLWLIYQAPPPMPLPHCGTGMHFLPLNVYILWMSARSDTRQIPFFLVCLYFMCYNAHFSPLSRHKQEKDSLSSSSAAQSQHDLATEEHLAREEEKQDAITDDLADMARVLKTAAQRQHDLLAHEQAQAIDKVSYECYTSHKYTHVSASAGEQHRAKHCAHRHRQHHCAATTGRLVEFYFVRLDATDCGCVDICVDVFVFAVTSAAKILLQVIFFYF